MLPLSSSRGACIAQPRAPAASLSPCDCRSPAARRPRATAVCRVEGGGGGGAGGGSGDGSGSGGQKQQGPAKVQSYQELMNIYKSMNPLPPKQKRSGGSGGGGDGAGGGRAEGKPKRKASSAAGRGSSGSGHDDSSGDGGRAERAGAQAAKRSVGAAAAVGGRGDGAARRSGSGPGAAAQQQARAPVSAAPPKPRAPAAAAAAAPPRSGGFGGFGSAAPAAAAGAAPAGFKGFGRQSAAAAAAAAASAAAAGNPRALRVYRYAVDLEKLRDAVDGAGLSGDVAVVQQVSEADAIVSMKLTPNGTPIKLVQGWRTAQNAGLPFVVIGRRLTPDNTRRALRPLVDMKRAGRRPGVDQSNYHPADRTAGVDRATAKGADIADRWREGAARGFEAALGGTGGGGGEEGSAEGEQ